MLTLNMNKIDFLLDKAKALKGLSPEEAEFLLLCNDFDTQCRVIEAAKFVKQAIYGRRIVLFAPLYVSNECDNNCLYCGFQKSNKDSERKTLTSSEILEETKALIDKGVKRILLVSSESSKFTLDKLIEAIECCYSAKTEKGEIRRINVNVAPLSTENFKILKKAKIGTYQVFQETYNCDVYSKMHPSGKKSDYKFRYEAPFRALEAGIGDVGMGVLFGLSDPVSEVKALLKHIEEMVKIYGIGPHTISVPRIKPAKGAKLSFNPPYKISDDFFTYLIAVLRIAVPYTGIILSTRETQELRDKLFGVGVSQISAASSTTPGGYINSGDKILSQFTTSDERSLEEVVIKLCESGHIPSFCTACYRKGRVGEDFMDLAKDGTIKNFCDKNALLSFAEYAINFLHSDKQDFVKAFIKDVAKKEIQDQHFNKLLDKVFAGEKDVFI